MKLSFYSISKLSDDTSNREVQLIEILGEWTFPNASDLELSLLELKDELEEGIELRIDFSKLKEFDNCGSAFFQGLLKEYSGDLSKIEYLNIPDFVKRIFRSSPDMLMEIKHEQSHNGSFLEKLGEQIIGFFKTVFELAVLFTDAIYYANPFSKTGGKTEKNEVIRQSGLIGTSSLLMVCLLCFIVGLTIALQSANQLRDFGANIFIVDLMWISISRELGPLITSIILAGRSGSAFAAEIASMKVSEEIMALRSMGISPVKYLVSPKLVAITFCMPVLVSFANLAGIFGGMLIAIFYLDLTVSSFFEQLTAIMQLKDVMTGLVKSLVFAWLIVLIGTYKGFSIRGGAEEVGKVTTSSVVVSIIAIIIADALLGILFYF